MTAEKIADHLRLLGPELQWARRLEAFAPPPGGLETLSQAQVADRLAELGVAGEDAVEIVATTPSPVSTPEWWWLLERCAGRLVAAIGKPEERRGWWPDWVGPRSTPERRCFMAHVYLAVAPFTARWHRSRGIADSVSRDSFADLARHLAIHRRVYGCTGIDNAWWLTMSLRGEVFDLGRLQFNWFTWGTREHAPFWYPWEEAELLGDGFRKGDGCLGVHIPETGALDPRACDESVAAAAHFFREHFAEGFPAGRRRLATCLSWLLDDQLAAFLPETSNIIAFQRRFERLEGGYVSDREVLDFVYRLPLADPPAVVTDPHSALSWLDWLQPASTLEKAVVEHLRAGGHWRVRMGWFEL